MDNVTYMTEEQCKEVIDSGYAISTLDFSIGMSNILTCWSMGVISGPVAMELTTDLENTAIVTTKHHTL